MPASYGIPPDTTKPRRVEAGLVEILAVFCHLQEMVTGLTASVKQAQ